MERNELTTYVRKYFRWLQEITGCAIEDAIASNAKSFTVTLGTYEAKKHLVKILNSLNTNKRNWLLSVATGFCAIGSVSWISE